MKTSLNVEDSLFRAARREALKNRKTLGETISEWARIGRESLLKKKKGHSRVLQAVDLGPAQIDISSRRDWMDFLDR